LVKRNKKKSKYRSGLEDKIVPRALALGAEYEPVSLAYPCGERKYKPDLVLPNGIVIEIKGWFTPADRAKTLKVLAAYPGLELRFVMQRPETTLDGRSKTTNAMWLDAHNIKWAKGDIPDSWYREPTYALSVWQIVAAPKVKKSTSRPNAVTLAAMQEAEEMAAA
jgi:Autographiviridae endonuclease I